MARRVALSPAATRAAAGTQRAASARSTATRGMDATAAACGRQLRVSHYRMLCRYHIGMAPAGARPTTIDVARPARAAVAGRSPVRPGAPGGGGAGGGDDGKGGEDMPRDQGAACVRGGRARVRSVSRVRALLRQFGNRSGVQVSHVARAGRSGGRACRGSGDGQGGAARRAGSCQCFLRVRATYGCSGAQERLRGGAARVNEAKARAGARG